jgi:multiple sugar transport system permease protein
MLMTAFQPMEQRSMPGAPIWPATIASFEYQGKKLDVYYVPQPDGSTKEMAALKKTNKVTTFIDPKNPEAEPFVYEGSWRTLERPWKFKIVYTNFVEASKAMNYPRLFYNTTMYAFWTTVGVLFSCILVAYGFSRFRFPGRDLLFILVISTIFLPGTVTLIPTYTFWVKLGLVGTYVPLILPAFFANAYDVFLLRQYMLTIPRELDEAATIDGAGPLQVLWYVIIPASWPAIIAVSVFHIVYAWNDFFGPLIYLSTKPDLQPISVALSFFNGLWGSYPTYIQAASLMTMIVPMILFLLAQRFFIQGVVITGVEK